jgi:hypothetical protein
MIDKRYEKHLADITSDDAVQAACWLSVASALAEQGLAQQSSVVVKLAGTYRFPRVGSIYPLAKISFLIDDIDSLETYTKAISKLDLKSTPDAARTYSSLFLQLSLFDLSIMIGRLSYISDSYSSLPAEKRTTEKTRELMHAISRVV